MLSVMMRNLHVLFLVCVLCNGREHMDCRASIYFLMHLASHAGWGADSKQASQA